MFPDFPQRRSARCRKIEMLPRVRRQREHTMFQLPSLRAATVLARPSRSIKSPYVADIRFHDTQEVALCHTPGLGCSGMVEAGATILVSDAPQTKTRYAAQIAVVSDTAAAAASAAAADVVYVGVRPMLNQLLAGQCLERVAPGVPTWESEVVLPSDPGTRLDYVGYTEAGKAVYVEIKNAMVSHELDVPRHARRAIFPDGFRKTLRDPISPRAIKHALALADLCGRPDTDAAILLFLVSRSDCGGGLVINPEDPTYCDALRVAIRAGVRIYAFAVDFTVGGAVTLVGQVPVYIDL